MQHSQSPESVRNDHHAGPGVPHRLRQRQERVRRTVPQAGPHQPEFQRLVVSPQARGLFQTWSTVANFQKEMPFKSTLKNAFGRIFVLIRLFYGLLISQFSQNWRNILEYRHLLKFSNSDHCTALVFKSFLPRYLCCGKVRWCICHCKPLQR